ncbi:response regulator [Lutimaribacter marinistellae]|uniref:Response regulator n=1 Tax=Lutimaribacter marinistellae TaxID=1820329 RepID=A0ABV7TFN6_9RHOB
MDMVVQREASQSKVLVVEDELIIGMDLVMTLEDWGYRAEGPLNSVAKALDSIENETPDIAILDVNLGKTETSMPLAERLTELGIPYVFLTGYDPARYENGPENLHAPYLRKPLDQGALQDLLQEMVPAHNARHRVG